MKLFAAYAGGGVMKESDLAPTDLMEFERVWTPHAPDRCLECSTVLDAPGEYCGNECRNAGAAVICTRCQGKAERVTLRTPTELEKHLICTACDPPLLIGDDRLAKVIHDGRRYIGMLSGHFKWKFDVAHEPAWKKRRRS